MKKDIVVTVGMCVRNCESTLVEAVESIVKQDFPHELMELILVDDGSKDGTSSIVIDQSKRTNLRTKLFCHEWKGLGYSRNVVLGNAEGTYVLWVDGDMVLSSDYLKRLVDYMETHPEVAAVKGKQALKPGGNLLATLEGFSRAASRMVDYSSEKSRQKSLGTGGTLYRLEAAVEAGGFDEKLRGYGEDTDIEIRLRERGWRLAVIDTEFQDYERCELTWSSLWNRYWLRGYYTHYLLQKNKGLLKYYKMIPPAGFINGLFQANILFRLTNRSEVFLLPFQHFFKMTAWCDGFLHSHLNRYQPTSTVFEQQFLPRSCQIDAATT
jgi:glycosyltransferase involved in cell wall biosynthesis